MAIKVRHDGNAAATAVAGVGSGTAKRRVETAKLAQNTTQHVQTLSPAHASAPGASAPGIMGAGHATAPSAGGGSAPLTHAPNGASGASAPLTHAPSPTGGGGAGSRSSSLRGSGAGGDLGEVKVTGTSIFERPDKESQWNPSTMRWERPWLPGEKEAEAAQRMNPVLAEREQFRHGLADESAAAKAQQERDLFDYKLTQKQKMELAAINDALEEARKSGRYTPEEMAELEKQAYQQRMSIKPLPTPREKDAQKSFDERIVTAGGIQGYINSKGDFEPFQKDDGFANFLKAYPKLAEYTEDVTQTDPATGKQITVPVTKTRTADEIAKLVTDAQAAWNKARGVNQAQPAAPSGIDPAVMQIVNPLLFQQIYGGGQAQPEQPAGPYAPPPPPTPEETRKRWSAFKVN